MGKQSLLQASLLAALVVVASANLLDYLEITWGNERAKILDNGHQLQLSLDKASGSGFQSKQKYLFGWFEMEMKLVPGDSAGTVTTLYLLSQGSIHDEIDLEFLGNTSGQPYVLHTNVYTQGKGGREQQFYLWFDPRKDFHTYAILWNPQMIALYVDATPIRVFRNNQAKGVAYADREPMRLFSSLWNADSWATQGGRVKTNWTNAPFVASFRHFRHYAFAWTGEGSSCSGSNGTWWHLSLDTALAERLNWVRKNWMIYDYCQDPTKGGPECYLNA